MLERRTLVEDKAEKRGNEQLLVHLTLLHQAADRQVGKLERKCHEPAGGALRDRGLSEVETIPARATRKYTSPNRLGASPPSIQCPTHTHQDRGAGCGSSGGDDNGPAGKISGVTCKGAGG